jgi:hypothetical protein
MSVKTHKCLLSAPAAIALSVACAAILAVWAVHLHDAVNGRSLTSGMEKEGLHLCLRGWEGARGGRHGNGAHQRPPPEAAQRRQVVLQLPAGRCCVAALHSIQPKHLRMKPRLLTPGLPYDKLRTCDICTHTVLFLQANCPA